MKRLLAWFLYILFSGMLTFAQTIVAEPMFKPLSPALIAQGDSFTAVSSGYDSLFTNPAGFSRGETSLTIVSANPWVRIRPDQIGTALQGVSAGNSENLSSMLADQVLQYGFGIGASTGIGWVGNGLGLGLIGVLDSSLSATDASHASGYVHGTVAFIGGLSFPLDLFGFKLHLGVDVRPMVRVRAPIDNVSVSTFFSDVFHVLGQATAFHGIGVGLDAGAILELGPFSVGVSARDIAGTRFNYSTSSLGDLITTLKFFGGTSLSRSGGQFVVPMNISAGIALHPDFGDFKKIVDFMLHGEMQDITGVIQGTASPWSLLHVGAELKLFSFLSLRGGMDRGVVTAGAGVKLLFLDFNGAVFMDLLGVNQGTKPYSGISIEAAIRI